MPIFLELHIVETSGILAETLEDLPLRYNGAQINQRLERLMREAYAAVAQVSREHKVTLRTAAFIVACTRILQARQVRGLYP